METVEIRVVKNGYVVLPPHGPMGYQMDRDRVHVFETFDGLVAWLAKNIGPSSEKFPNRD